MIADPSHGTGKSALVSAVSKAAVAAGANGLLIEVHPAATSESPAAPPTLPASGSEPPAPSIVTPPTGGSASDGRATGSTGTGTGPGTETASVAGGSGGAGGVADAAAPAPDPLDEPSGGGFEPAGSDTPASGGGVSPTPEPGSVLLVGSGLIAILGLLRKRRLI